MGPEEFRRLALSFPGAEEQEHMDHPDFRVDGKIFATLGYPDEGWAMVKLKPEQQAAMLRTEPEIFKPVKGAWGRFGATYVRLKAAKRERVRKVLAVAWENVAKNRPGKRSRVGVKKAGAASGRTKRLV